MRSAPSARRALFSASLVASAFLFAGCGALFGNRYNDFRAYYNAYYNASRVLEEGESQLDRDDAIIDRTRLISLYPTAVGGRGSGFQEAIDKSSELLRNRGDSKWADDALFLIGKAYYYQNNSVGAEQKFRETIELATVRNNERLADEARIWLGRTLGGAQRYEEGTTILQDRLAAAEGNRGDLARIRLVLGELYAREGRYDEAAESIRLGLGDERDSDFAARGSMLLGQVLEADGQYEDAADAYLEVTRRQPPYELAYAANLSRALVLGLDAGKTPEALDLIRRMRRDDKNYDHRAEVELAYGRLLAAGGQPQEAVDAMRAVLYDPLLSGTSLRGEAHARLAEFYRDVRADFVRASAHFDTASTVIRTSISPGEAATRAALLDVRRTAAAFKAYSSVAVRLAEADSLYDLGSLSEDAFRERIEEIEAKRLADYLEEQRQLAETRASQEFAGGAQGFGERPGTGAGQASGATSASGRDVGFLSFRDPASVQANLLAFQRNWGERALVPNWRRQAAVDAAVVTTTEGEQIDPDRLGRGFPGGGPPPLDLGGVPRTPEALAALRVERASLRYEVANSLFLSLARPDSAAALYALALEDNPEPDVANQIRFALAEVETARGGTDRAEELYRTLIEEAPESELATAARLRLGIEAPEVAEVEDATSDAYDAVAGLWRSGEYPEAVEGFLALAADSARSADSPRALLAASVAYIEWAHADGFDVHRPLPDSLLPGGLLEATLPELPPAASGAEPRIGVPIPEPSQNPVAPPLSTPEAPPGTVPDKPTRTSPPAAPPSTVPDKPTRTPRPSGVPDKPTRTPRATPPPVQERPAELTLPEEAEAPEPPRARREPGEGDELLRLEAPAAGEQDGEIDGDEVQLPDDEVVAPVRRSGGLTPPPPPVIDDVVPDSLTTPEAALDSLPEAIVDSVGIGEPTDLANAEPEAPEAETAQPVEEPLAIPVDTLATDSLIVPQPVGPTVTDVLALVQERAPGTPFAERAAAMVAGLMPDADALSEDGASPEASGDEGASGVDTGLYGFEGTLPLDPGAGGFTWRAQRLPSAEATRALLADYARRAIRAAAIQDGDSYRVVVGQFASRPDAFGMRDDLPTEVQGSGASIVPLEGLELLGPEDLSPNGVPIKGE